MKFDINVKNFGKVRDAKIKIRPFTVIAGPNSSGKSFITKALYSFFSTINKDHVAARALDAIQKVSFFANYSNDNIYRPSSLEIELFSNFISSCEEAEAAISINLAKANIDELDERVLLVVQPVKSMLKEYEALKNELSGKQKFKKMEAEFAYIERLIHDILNIIKNPHKCLEESIESGFTNEIKGNFQASKLNDLKNFNTNENERISFNFSSLGSISFDKKISFELTKESIQAFQKLHNVVFLESPLYWRMKSALEVIRYNKRLKIAGSIRKQDSLTGVPKHFYDLTDFLKDDFVSNESDEDLLYNIENKIDESIGGKIDISNSGELTYQLSDTKNKINLHSTAMGITNLGVLSLLIKKNIICKGSFIFIDEPELNLHPAWQQIMVEALFQLSQYGVNVVIASHSVDMMKYIENIMLTMGEDEIDSHFGINQLSSDGTSLHDDDNPEEKISYIKEDLSKPFMNMFMESIWK